jgi:arylsulfatase A
MAATADRIPSVYINNGRIVNLDTKDPITVNYEKMVGDWPTGISHPQLLKSQADEQHSGTIVNGISRIGFMTGGKSALFKDEDMADTYLNKAQNFITSHAKPQANGEKKPFFLYYAPNENHVPRVVHQRFQGATSLGPRGDALAVFDWCVGRLIGTLKANGIYENTMIIISSDNGPVLFDGYWDGAIEKKGNHKAGGIWRGGKYSRWEAGTRVPFIVSWPNKVKPGISNALVSQVDLFASFAEMLGVEVPENAAVDSEKILPALLGHSDHGRDYVVQEALTQIAIRKGNWKYLPSGSIKERGDIGEWIETEVGDQGFLFNLTEDPNERKNVANLYPEIVSEMNAIIEKVAPEKASGAKNINKKQLGF